MYTLAIHGGAGTISRSRMTPETLSEYSTALLNSLAAGEKILDKRGSAMDAVTAAVVSLENNPLFNAGKGAVFNNAGGHELDASVMDGSSLTAGAVTCVTWVKNPVLLARLVMEKTDHVFLAGAGAEDLARQYGLEMETAAYFHTSHRFEQWQKAKNEGQIILDHSDDRKFGTVGAVAMDVHGNLAAATSTGGMTNKKYNRIGDTPIIGAGTYANNNTCAVSCTGHGEFFIRGVVAYDVSCLMEYKGLSLREACEKVVMDKLVALGGEGGLIAVDAQGNAEMVFNSEGMYRGRLRSGSQPEVLIYR